MPDDIVQQLRDAACGNDCHCHYCERNKAAANEIERLTLERDEARREVCELQASEVNRLASAIRLKGWICFEEKTHEPAAVPLAP
jgi:hypothetical protein